MTGSAKRKGDRAELEIAGILSDLTGFDVRRELGAGRLDDCGDLRGVPNTVIQVADWTDALRAIRAKPIDAERQEVNAGAYLSCAAIRLRGGVWRMCMTPEQFATFVREAL